jgi:hypothetical protein
MNEESFIESFVDEFKSAMDAYNEAHPLAPMTATEVRLRREAEFARMDRVQKEAEAVKYWLKFAPPVEYPPIDIHRLHDVYMLLCARRLDPGSVSIAIPEKDFLALRGEFSPKLDESTSSMRWFGMEILRGGREDVAIWLSADLKMVKPDRIALEAEILRRLGRGGVGELPQSASSNGVSPSVKTVGEIGVTPGAAARSDRNPNRFAHLSDEAKVIAAKAAIAAYGRDKNLPAASALALFRELDGKRAGNKRAGAKHAWSSFKFVEVSNIHGNDHSLSAEPLSRAIDQIWVRENGGAYADLVCSRAERLAEVANAGDPAANR